MSTTTANLGLTLPTPNVDSGWGGTLNTDFTLIDDLFTANGSGTSVGLQVGSGKVLNAGGTIIAGGTMILGSGDGTNTVVAPTIRGAARTGTNAAGANLTIDAANGTGTGGSGNIIFRTAPASTTGSVANTMASVFEVNSAGAVGVNGASYGTAKQVLLSGGSTAATTWGAVDGTVINIASQAQGDILYYNGTSWVRLAAGTANQFLQTKGAAANPVWATGITTTTGSAPYYGARAFVNFDGTGTPSIRAGLNVSSVTSNGTGDYTITFTTAMPDANYVVTGSARRGSSSNRGVALEVAPATALSTSSVRVRTISIDTDPAPQNCTDVYVAIFR
jgi:hypothetical protein